VEDRRNILVTRLAEPVSPETAVTVTTALERGIEAAFQLEDGELEGELLPDPEHHGRALLIESAEGGAGVLRRLVSNAADLRLAARAALELMHFDPDTGADQSAETAAKRGEEPCVRGCYDCLLSYRNQNDHELIDRRLAVTLMLRLSTCTLTDHAPAGRTGDDRTAAPGKPGAAAFVGWLRSRDLRLPDDVDAMVEGTRPDLVYRLPDGNVAVFVGEDDGREDDQATEVLRDLGWGVILIGGDSDWQTVVSRYPSVFGTT
jgi:hypothetical protein